MIEAAETIAKGDRPAAPRPPADADATPPGRRLRQIRQSLRGHPLRIALTVAFALVALLVARFGWSSPLLPLERNFYDLRVYLTAPVRPQDQRVVLVDYNEGVLARTGRRSPVDRLTLARALARLDTLGARGIAIDILIDQPQPEDAALAKALRAMRTPTFLGYVRARDNPDQMYPWQQAYLDRFLAGLAGSRVRTTALRLVADKDRSIRLWPDAPAGLPPVMARALAGDGALGKDYAGPIRFVRTPGSPTPFVELDIDLFSAPPVDSPDYWAAMRSQVAGRYVLVGGDLPTADRMSTPLTNVAGPSDTFGLAVHATMLAQLLDGAGFAPVPHWSLWLAAVLVVLGGTMAVLVERPLLNAAVIGVETVIVLVLPFVLQARGIDTYRLPAAGWLIGWLLTYLVGTAAARRYGSEQRRFAQDTLGRYLPPDVASQILRDPDLLNFSGAKCHIYALFSDLEGFTKLSHAVSADAVARVLNDYLDRISDIVLAHGGTIDKFVGDAVVAFWGAPVARPGDADRAVQAAIAIHAAGERFRRETHDGVPPMGRTRVGVHFGEAVVGNFGGKGRIQYTAIGDTMNCAARLESANKQLASSVLVSEAVTSRTGLDIFRPLGRVVLSGRAEPLNVFEPVPLVPEVDRVELDAIYRRYDSGDPAALRDLAGYVRDRPGDDVLVRLLARLETVRPGGSHVFETK